MPARRKRPISVAITGPDKAGMFHAFLNAGRRADGRPDRRHRMGRTADEVADKIRALEDELAAGRKPAVGRPLTVEDWLRHWVEVIVPARGRKYSTLTAYRTNIYRHLIPTLGGHILSELEPEHVETAMLKLANTKVRGKPRSAATVHQAYRTLRTALGVAVKRGRAPRNAAALADSPPAGDTEVTPLSVDEARRLIAACESRVRGARWALALSLGMRQGEALALTWSAVDLEAGTITVGRTAYRRKLEHGCADPRACAALHCRTGPCPPSWAHGCDDTCGKGNSRHCPQRVAVRCKRHARGCPPPCRPDCTGHAKACPKAVGGIEYATPKSTAGRRVVALPDPLVKALSRHQTQQKRERLRAGSKWVDNGLVFAGPRGEPIDHRRDWQDWRDLLAAAGVPPARVHAARHTAATMLLVQGVNERTVMDIMGWSQRSMLTRYQHVVDELRTEAARRMGTLLWQPPSSGASSNDRR